MEHLDHLTGFRELLLHMILHLSALRRLLRFLLCLVLFYKADLGTENLTWEPFLELECVLGHFDRRSESRRLDLSVTHHWIWIVHVDKIVLICIFHCEHPVASTGDINPLYLLSYVRRWRIQINTLLWLSV